MNLSIDSTELIYLLLGPGILVLIALLLRHDLRLKAQCEALQTRLNEAEDRLSLLHNRLGDDSRERELESKIALLTAQQEQLMLRDSEAGPYFRAVRLAGNGAGADALIEQTGVTRAEAELIVNLHGTARGSEQGVAARPR